MRRTLVALVLSAVGVLVAPVSPADALRASARSGTEQTRAAPLTLVPASDASTDSTGSLTVTVDPGETTTGSLVLTNTSTDLRLSVRLAAVDANRDSARITFAEEATLDGAGSWITTADRVVLVEPGASTPIGFTVDVPPDAAAGVALGGVTARVERATALTNTPRGDVEGLSVSRAIAVSVTGPPTPQLNVISVKPTTENGKHYLAVLLRNSGSLPAVGRATVRVPTQHVTRQVDVSVPPFSDTTELVEWTPGPAASTATVSVDYSNDSTASWSGRVGGDSSGTTTPTESSGHTPTPQSKSHGASPANRLLPALVILVAIAAAAWLTFEFTRARQQRVRMPLPYAYTMPPAAGVPVMAVSDAASRAVLESLVARVSALERSVDRLADGLAEGLAQGLDRARAPGLPPPATTEPATDTESAVAGRLDVAQPSVMQPNVMQPSAAADAAARVADFVASDAPVVTAPSRPTASETPDHDRLEEESERERRTSVRRTRDAMRSIVTRRSDSQPATGDETGLGERPRFVTPSIGATPPAGAPADLYSWPPDDVLERFAEQRRTGTEAEDADDERTERP